MMAETLEGILPVDKSEGWTSHDVVAKIRRLIGVRKVGHAGTLDPMATGVLLLCLGRATRLVSYLVAKEKEYRVSVRLGIATDTFDAEGVVVERSEAVPSDLNTIRKSLERFEGEIDQVPPMFSALKVGGKKLYSLARRGKVVEREPRKVHIHKIELEGLDGRDLNLRVVCSKGTYVRTLADDLGRSLGCGGHVASLRRIRVGDIRVEDCETIDAVVMSYRDGRLAESLLPTDYPILELPAIQLDRSILTRFCSGQRVHPENRFSGPEGSKVRVVGCDGLFYGIGTFARDDTIRASSVFREVEHS